MVVEGAIVGGVLAALFFVGIQKEFIREGVVTSLVWILANWGLDCAALLPFAGQSLGRYFQEIGLRYLAIVSPVMGIAYVLHVRQERKEP